MELKVYWLIDWLTWSFIFRKSASFQAFNNLSNAKDRISFLQLWVGDIIDCNQRLLNDATRANIWKTDRRAGRSRANAGALCSIRWPPTATRLAPMWIMNAPGFIRFFSLDEIISYQQRRLQRIVPENMTNSNKALLSRSKVRSNVTEI